MSSTNKNTRISRLRTNLSNLSSIFRRGTHTRTRTPEKDKPRKSPTPRAFQNKKMDKTHMSDSDIESKVFLLEYPNLEYETYNKQLRRLEGNKLLIRIETEKTKKHLMDTNQRVTALFSVKDNKLNPPPERYDEYIIHGNDTNNRKNLENLVDYISSNDIYFYDGKSPSNLKYQLTFMPIESYLFQHEMDIHDKEIWLRRINELMDKNGTTIPTDVWNYIMEFILDPGPKPHRLKGGKRTRRRLKKTRK